MYDVPLEAEFPHIKSYIDRTSALALLAAKRALADAGLGRQDADSKLEIGCAYGTTLGCLDAMGIFWNKCKTSNPKFAQPLPFTHGYANSPSSLLCIEFGLRGPAATFSGEKLAGLEALTFAADQIAAGSGEIILAGASESLVQQGWAHLLASGQLGKSGKWDDGLIPGEGAVMLVLESEPSAKARGARIYAEIEGTNFFPVKTSSKDPITIGTNASDTIQFVSIPNVHASGGWVQPLKPDMATVATKYYTGDMLSVSGVLNAALAAGLLGGKFKIAREPGQPGIPLLFSNCRLQEPREAVATAYDPSGSLGVVLLRSV
ncbi:MAG TPA: beta-ketoacyl synthase N-terminal-like domain-containing protein [Planctomycetota bacterium]|nr:beta-ketoacyl synthase N-terminal-like domain-containing protein [Planctomycetota bacterium]